jgi:hypothetical protein
VPRRNGRYAGRIRMEVMPDIRRRLSWRRGAAARA